MFALFYTFLYINDVKKRILAKYAKIESQNTFVCERAIFWVFNSFTVKKVNFFTINVKFQVILSSKSGGVGDPPIPPPGFTPVVCVCVGETRSSCSCMAEPWAIIEMCLAQLRVHLSRDKNRKYGPFGWEFRVLASCEILNNYVKLIPNLCATEIR